MVFLIRYVSLFPRGYSMSLKNSLYAVVTACSVVVPGSLSASPQIKVDSANFNIGIVKEENSVIARHTFIISNPGDSTLVISNVRPGCGCTTAGYDSIIPPGKTGRIKVEVNTEHFGDGIFEKRVTVASNAAHDAAMLALTITGVKQSVIAADPQAVHFNAGAKRDTGVVILLKTERKNLEVTGVNFAFDQNDPLMSWRSSIPMSYTLTRVADAAAAQSNAGKEPGNPALITYKLTVPYSPAQKGDLYGELVIKTNLPEKPELKISGMIESVKQ